MFGSSLALAVETWGCVCSFLVPLEVQKVVESAGHIVMIIEDTIISRVLCYVSPHI